MNIMPITSTSYNQRSNFKNNSPMAFGKATFDVNWNTLGEYTGIAKKYSPTNGIKRVVKIIFGDPKFLKAAENASADTIIEIKRAFNHDFDHFLLTIKKGEKEFPTNINKSMDKSACVQVAEESAGYIDKLNPKSN